MVDTGAGANDIFWHIEQIQIAYMRQQAHGYFGLIVIGNVGNQVLSKTLVVSTLQKLSNNE